MANERDKIIIENMTEDVPLFEGDERRIPVQLLHYWDEIRGNRLFPSEHDIDHEVIKDIWDHCYLIQVNDLENRLKVDFTFLGAAILKSYHDYLSEDDAVDIISPKSSGLAQNFRTVIATKMPLMQSGQFVNKRGNIIDFRQSLLPLGLSDNKVNEIFGCVRLAIRP